MDDNYFGCGYMFEQEEPEREISALVASEDISEPYELDATAVFKTRDGGFLAVTVSSCSCWPLYGSTTQHYERDSGAMTQYLQTLSGPYRRYNTLVDKFRTGVR